MLHWVSGDFLTQYSRASNVDVVISNGVINLSPDKDAVFQEIARVLKPGGRLQMADITVEVTVPESGKSNVDLWTG